METVMERALRAGEVEIEDYSMYTMTTMLQAGAMGYPFLPVISGIRESDVYHTESFFAGQKFAEVECPFTGEKMVVVKGRNPDVTVVHVQRADKFGNAHFWGALVGTKWACLAADKVIVSCEEIVDEETIMRSPHFTIVPGFRVCAVVEEPWGAHPSELLGYYGFDIVFRTLFFGSAARENTAKAWMDEWVYGVEDRKAYLQHYVERLGQRHLDNVKAKPCLSVPADYGGTGRRPWDEHGMSHDSLYSRQEFLEALVLDGEPSDG